MTRLLDGQVVVVTGAGRGWGHSVCRMMARHGARVIATSEVAHELEELQRTVQDEGGEIEIVVLDLTDRKATEAFGADVLARYGRVTTLVNGAAILRNRHFLDLTQDQVEVTLEVMLVAPMRLIRAFAPGMISARSGSNHQHLIESGTCALRWRGRVLRRKVWTGGLFLRHRRRVPATQHQR